MTRPASTTSCAFTAGGMHNERAFVQRSDADRGQLPHELCVFAGGLHRDGLCVADGFYGLCTGVRGGAVCLHDHLDGRKQPLGPVRPHAAGDAGADRGRQVFADAGLHRRGRGAELLRIFIIIDEIEILRFVNIFAAIPVFSIKSPSKTCSVSITG